MVASSVETSRTGSKATWTTTVPVHGDARGLAAALIEVRQDLVTDVFNIERWSRLLADALASVTQLVELRPP